MAHAPYDWHSGKHAARCECRQQKDDDDAVPARHKSKNLSGPIPNMGQLHGLIKASGLDSTPKALRPSARTPRHRAQGLAARARTAGDSTSDAYQVKRSMMRIT